MLTSDSRGSTHYGNYSNLECTVHHEDGTPKDEWKDDGPHGVSFVSEVNEGVTQVPSQVSPTVSDMFGGWGVDETKETK